MLSLKNDLPKLKYAYAVIELVKNLMAEREVNKQVFKGVVRILSRINSSNEKPDISFGRFFLNSSSSAACGRWQGV